MVRLLAAVLLIVPVMVTALAPGTSLRLENDANDAQRSSWPNSAKLLQQDENTRYEKEHYDPQPIKSFWSWLQENGATGIDDLEVKDFTKPVAGGQAHIRGMAAMSHEHDQDILFALPRNVLMYAEHPKLTSTPLHKVANARERVELYLASESTLGPKSFWAPLVNHLPSNSDYRRFHPFHGRKAIMKEFDFLPIVRFIHGQQTTLEEKWAAHGKEWQQLHRQRVLLDPRLQAANRRPGFSYESTEGGKVNPPVQAANWRRGFSDDSSEGVSLIQRGEDSGSPRSKDFGAPGSIDPSMELTFDTLKWAHTVFKTRSYSGKWSEAGMLVPVADIMNTAVTPNTKWKPRLEGDKWVMHVVGDVKPGEELFDRYQKDKDNTVFFRIYGMLLANNPTKPEPIQKSVCNSDRVRKAMARDSDQQIALLKMLQSLTKEHCPGTNFPPPGVAARLVDDEGDEGIL